MTIHFLGNDKMPLYKELSQYTIQTRYAPWQPPSEGGTVNMGKEKYGRVLQHFEARNKFANKKKLLLIEKI